MPCAESPSAIALTSSGCNLQNSAIWSKVRAVLSNSQTAVAFGIKGAGVAMANLLYASSALRAKHQIIGDDWKVAGI